MPGNTPSTLPAGARKRDRLGLLLTLLCLTGFAITEPLLGIFGENPGIFAFYNIEDFSSGIRFALTIALLPALALWLTVVATLKISPRAGIALLHLLVAMLAGLWCIQLAKWRLGVSGIGELLLAGLLGGSAIAYAHARWRIVSAWVRIAAIAPVIAVGVFLFSSATSDLFSEPQELSAKEPGASDVDYPSVLFVLLDEFPTAALFNEEGAIDQRRYPGIASLAATSTWYSHYTVLADKTSLSVPSLLSGQRPSNGPATSAHYPTNLFALLAPTHHLTVFEAVGGLCSYPECGEGPPGTDIRRARPRIAALLARATRLWLQRVSPAAIAAPGLDDYQETLVPATPAPQKKSQSLMSLLLFKPEKLVGYTQAKPERLQRLRATFAADAEPALYFIHLELPHVPWRFYPDGTLYDAPVKKLAITASNNDDNAWMARIAEYRFTLQAQYTDHLLDELFSHLKQLGIWDDMLIVVTADHGRSFELNTNARVARRETLDSIAYAPLFIKAPQQKTGQVDTSNLMAYDLLPTIAATLGLELPWQVAGLPAGDVAITARGEEKEFFPLISETTFKPHLGKKLVFADSEHLPSYSSRWIGAQSAADDTLTLLNASLNLDNYLGRSTAEFAFEPGGQASVEELSRLRRPGASQPMGIVMGVLEFEPRGDAVLVAINGRFVSGSPLFEFKDTPHTFLAMLPNGVLAANNEVDIYLHDSGDLTKLRLR